jgi:hypothetical protein
MRSRLTPDQSPFSQFFLNIVLHDWDSFFWLGFAPAERHDGCRSDSSSVSNSEQTAIRLLIIMVTEPEARSVVNRHEREEEDEKF